MRERLLNKLENVLIDTDLWESLNLKEVRRDLDFPAQLPKVCTFLESIELDSCELVKRCNVHCGMTLRDAMILEMQSF